MKETNLKSYEKIKEKFKERKKELLEKTSNKIPLIAYHCLFVPKEIIKAGGADCLELASLAKLYGCEKDQFEIVEEYMPHGNEEICAFCRWHFMKLKKPSSQVAAVIGVTTCSSLIKTVSMLPQINPGDFSCPFHIMNLPRRIDDKKDFDYWVKEVEHMKALVEEVTGKEITDEDLEIEIIKENRLRSLLLEILELRRTQPIPLKGSQASLLADLQFVLETSTLIEGLEELIKELKILKEKGIGVYEPNAPRILVSGPTLHEHIKDENIDFVKEPSILELIENTGAAIVAEDFCAGIRSFWKPIPYDDRPPIIRIAEHYADVINCACQTPNERRIEQCTMAILTADIKGVIYINLRTCKIFAAEIKKLEECFTSLGVPFLAIERTGEPETEHVEQLKNRIEAFVQMIKAT